MQHDIATLFDRPVPLENCVLECAAEIVPNLRFALHGHGEHLRKDYRIVIRDPGFKGRLTIVLGPGTGEIILETGGPFNADFRMWRDASVRVGPDSTCNNARIIADQADIRIGADALWSDEVLIQSNDQHGIIDAGTGQVLNAGRRHVTIGDHVWLGRRATVMPDTAIGQGAIIAAGAVVTRDLPQNCAAAGIPAEVVREGVSWSRHPGGLLPREKQWFPHLR